MTAVILSSTLKPGSSTGEEPNSPGRGRFRVVPGLLLCCGISLLALTVERVELVATGRAWLEGLVVAILIGTGVRTTWSPGERWLPGIRFGAKTLLEVAVVLLGASISAATVLAAGWGLLAGIAGVVSVALCASYGMGRALGLPHRMAVLIACGNSICGNSAIAAVAPVIGAEGKDVTAAIAFTAVLGVVVVLGLPLLVPVLSLSGLQFGVLAGLTVYAVPQVLAATAPIGTVAVHIGTLVKLVRVLMLGPVVLVLSLLNRHIVVGESGVGASAGSVMPRRPALHQMVPWFIAGFLVLVGLRSVGALPAASLGPVAAIANLLTIVSMAALGLGTDLKIVARSGGRVTAAVVLSLLVLGGISFGLIRTLSIP